MVVLIDIYCSTSKQQIIGALMNVIRTYQIGSMVLLSKLMYCFALKYLNFMQYSSIRSNNIAHFSQML